MIMALRWASPAKSQVQSQCHSELFLTTLHAVSPWLWAAALLGDGDDDNNDDSELTLVAATNVR